MLSELKEKKGRLQINFLLTLLIYFSLEALKLRKRFWKQSLPKETISELNIVRKNMIKCLDISETEEKENPRVYSYSSMETSASIPYEHPPKKPERTAGSQLGKV